MQFKDEIHRPTNLSYRESLFGDHERHVVFLALFPVIYVQDKGDAPSSDSARDHKTLSSSSDFRALTAFDPPSSSSKPPGNVRGADGYWIID